jgi:hypothetical protein
VVCERPKYSAGEVRQILRGHFGDNRYLFMEEVRDATGFDAGRSADAVALGMYRTVGQLLWGFEIKVSRSDWVHELQQPEKSEAFLKYCDRFALVVSDRDIVKPGELPEPWGLLAPVETQMKLSADGQEKKLPRLEWVKECPALTPVPIDRVFLCAIMSAATEFSMQARARQERKWRDEGYEAGRKSAEERTGEARYREQLTRCEKVMYEFSQASGIDLNAYTDGKKLGELVNIAKDADRLRDSIEGQLFGWRLKELKAIVERIDNFSQRFEQVQQRSDDDCGLGTRDDAATQ